MSLDTRTDSGLGAAFSPSSSGTISSTLTETSDALAGILTQSETGSDRYSLLQNFFNMANTGSNAPGNMDYSTFGQPFTDPAADKLATSAVSINVGAGGNDQSTSISAVSIGNTSSDGSGDVGNSALGQPLQETGLIFRRRRGLIPLPPPVIPGGAQNSAGRPSYYPPQVPQEYQLPPGSFSTPPGPFLPQSMFSPGLSPSGRPNFGFVIGDIRLVPSFQLPAAGRGGGASVNATGTWYPGMYAGRAGQVIRWILGGR